MLTKIFVCLAALFAVAFSAEVLDDSNFEASVSNGDTWFVKFYAPWCGHCKRLAPTWDKLAEEVTASGSKAHVAKVDCTVARDVCSAQGIRGYPTLQLFKGGDSKNAIKYQGARDQSALADFIKQHEA